MCLTTCYTITWSKKINGLASLYKTSTAKCFGLRKLSLLSCSNGFGGCSGYFGCLGCFGGCGGGIGRCGDCGGGCCLIV